MPKVSKYIGERYVSVDWLQDNHGAAVDTHIDHVAVRRLNQKEKLVCYTRDIKRGVVLGPENLEQLVADFKSDDSDDWRGKPVTVFIDGSVTFGDRETGGVRVRAIAESPK